MGEYSEVRLGQLVPNPDNPRETLGDLDELAGSIGAIGVLQRLLVTPVGDSEFMVVDGHRRYWAMRSIEYSAPIPVEVRVMDRAERLASAVAAGTFTRPISPIDQAKAFRALEEMGLTRAQIEQRTGCNQPMISTRLRLLELSSKQQLDVHEGRMTLHQAKLATYEIGRRAPDRAPRHRTPAPPPVWMARAACRGTDPELFFPSATTGPTVAEPKRVCAGCPVRVECLLHALNEGEEHGIWGGLHEHERRRVRRGRTRLVS